MQRLSKLTHTQPFYGPFSGATQVSQCQKRTSGLMVQAEINRGRHTDHAAGRHSIRTNQCPSPPSPIFLSKLTHPEYYGCLWGWAGTVCHLLLQQVQSYQILLDTGSCAYCSGEKPSGVLCRWLVWNLTKHLRHGRFRRWLQPWILEVHTDVGHTSWWCCEHAERPRGDW